MKLIAVHSIQRRDDKGRRETIAPKASFEADPAEGERLVKAGAAKKPAKAKAEPAPAEDQGPGDVELTEMTKAELVKFAEDNNIEVDASAVKAEVLNTIEAALAGDDLV